MFRGGTRSIIKLEINTNAFRLSPPFPRVSRPKFQSCNVGDLPARKFGFVGKIDGNLLAVPKLYTYCEKIKKTTKEIGGNTTKKKKKKEEDPRMSFQRKRKKIQDY